MDIETKVRCTTHGGVGRKGNENRKTAIPHTAVLAATNSSGPCGPKKSSCEGIFEDSKRMKRRSLRINQDQSRGKSSFRVSILYGLRATLRSREEIICRANRCFD